MAKHIREFDNWVTLHDWPRVPCPECEVGSLALDGTPTGVVDPQSESVLELHAQHLGPPDELSGTFHGQLTCDNGECKRQVTIAGDWQLVFNDGDPSLGQFGDMYKVRYFNPPLALMVLPQGTPQKVREAIAVASSILWISPPASASRLRQAVEALLTARRIKRNVVSAKTKKQRRLDLHTRIELLRPTHPEVADALLAMKWIGNDGAHEDALSATQVLVGAAILEAALKALYDRSEKELMATVKKINAKKGLPKSKA